MLRILGLLLLSLGFSACSESAGDAEGRADTGIAPSIDAGDQELLLGPITLDGQPFAPFAAGEELFLGTCGQGQYHLWLALACPTDPGRGFATARVTNGDDDHAFPFRVGFELVDSLYYQPYARITLGSDPAVWLDRDIEVSVTVEDAPHLSAGPVSLRLVSGLDEPGRCCTPCTPGK